MAHHQRPKALRLQSVDGSVSPARTLPFRVLVVQMARLGDTIQILMALKAAKALYPQLEISLIVRRRFAQAAQRVSWIHRVYEFDTDEVLGPWVHHPSASAQNYAVGSLARWIKPLLEPASGWDLVLNWTYSEASSFLTALLPARIKLGYTRRRKDSTFKGADGWSHYLQAIVQGDIPQNIHLTDILTTQLLTALQIHLGEPSERAAGAEYATSREFFDLRPKLRLEPRSHHPRLVIQLGSGDPTKCWPISHWQSFIESILEHHLDWEITLLGGPEDTAKSQSILQSIQGGDWGAQAHRVVSLVGQTSFDDWAQVIAQAQWLVCVDTAAMHLASVLGVRCLNLSFGSVKFRETGPYGNGHYVVASQNTDIPTPQAVYTAWILATADWRTNRPTQSIPLSLQGVQILRSRIRHPREGGGVVYEALTPSPLTQADWCAMALGTIARSWYCGWVPKLGLDLKRTQITPELTAQLRPLAEASRVLGQIFDQAAKTASALHHKSSRLRSPYLMPIRIKNEIEDLSRALLELEALIAEIAQANPPLRAFHRMTQVLMHHLRGEHLSELSQSSHLAYSQLREGIQLWLAWIDHTLSLAQPVALPQVPNLRLVALPPGTPSGPIKESSPGEPHSTQPPSKEQTP